MSMGLRESARHNSWILIGFVIGFYGNWFVTILDRLSYENILQQLAVGFSFVVLLGYLLELTSTKKTQYLNYFFGLTHPLLIYLAIVIEGAEHLSSSYNYVGVTLWAMVLLIERMRIRRYET